MNAADILCEYIYASFLTVEAALEVAVSAAQGVLRTITAFFDAVISLLEFTIDPAMNIILDGVRVIQKKLVDLIWDGYKTDPQTGKKKSKFCQNLFKCNIFVEELTDRNSLTCSVLRKLGVLDSTKIDFLNSVIQDYEQFQSTICNFGFTFNFGLSALKKMLMAYVETISGFIKILESKKKGMKRLLQSYIDRLMDLSIFDLLLKLRKFFSCVLSNSDTCANIATAANYYADVLGKLHIQENGLGGYMLNSDDLNKYNNVFDSRLNKIGEAKQELLGIIDSLVNPSEVVAANKAFNLSTNIFPGGMSWTDIKNGNWNNNRMVKYLKVKADDFLDAFVRKHEKDLGESYESVSTEYLISGMTINDQTGEIRMQVNKIDETINPETGLNMDGYLSNMFEVVQCDIEYNIAADENPDAPEPILWNGELISGLRAAIMASVENDKKMQEYITSVHMKTADMFSEGELVTEW